jgi:hypothetical protein
MTVARLSKTNEIPGRWTGARPDAVSGIRLVALACGVVQNCCLLLPQHGILSLRLLISLLLLGGLQI